mmetsp:Transcript_83402/g.193838  ORF Transcript_83402/g.193838 Transcript_83402/m.193838 type:complete len:240 (+) Transcript_83402:324-1043(+)
MAHEWEGLIRVEPGLGKPPAEPPRFGKLLLPCLHELRGTLHQPLEHGLHHHGVAVVAFRHGAQHLLHRGSNRVEARLRDVLLALEELRHQLWHGDARLAGERLEVGDPALGAQRQHLRRHGHILDAHRKVLHDRLIPQHLQERGRGIAVQERCSTGEQISNGFALVRATAHTKIGLQLHLVTSKQIAHLRGKSRVLAMAICVLVEVVINMVDHVEHECPRRAPWRRLNDAALQQCRAIV